MLGIDDPLIALAYALCILSTLGCVFYSWRNWNRGDDSVQEADVRWAKEEDQRAE